MIRSNDLLPGARQGTLRWNRIAAVVSLLLILWPIGCQSPGGRTGAANGPDGQSAKQQAEPPSRAQDESPGTESDGEPTQATAPADRPDRWLIVVKPFDTNTGCWAKGEFDAERNKIGIVTENVAEFTVDTDRIPIDWSRLVVISIDGLNAELKRRDYTPLLFRREGFSSWNVVEP